jgi:hypothetical protein
MPNPTPAAASESKDNKTKQSVQCIIGWNVNFSCCWYYISRILVSATISVRAYHLAGLYGGHPVGPRLIQRAEDTPWLSGYYSQQWWCGCYKRQIVNPQRGGGSERTRDPNSRLLTKSFDNGHVRNCLIHRNSTHHNALLETTHECRPYIWFVREDVNVRKNTYRLPYTVSSLRSMWAGVPNVWKVLWLSYET